MKKIRITMTIAAFAVAVAGAVTSSALAPPEIGIFGYTPEGYCINQPGMQLPAGCNNSSGNQLCTAYFDDYGPLTIYRERWSAGECLVPYVKW